MILTVIPHGLFLPYLMYKAQPLVQLLSAFVPREGSNRHEMHIRIVESPIQRAKDSFRTVALALI
jgi:hypothetical protein